MSVLRLLRLSSSMMAALLLVATAAAGMATAADTATSAVAVPRPAADSSDDPPNIILILSDDQAWTDFGFMGHPIVDTPNLDRLSAEGALFTNGYVPTSLCRPSLASVVTGLYPRQHKITSNDPPEGTDGRPMQGFIKDLPVLPRLLKEAGYTSLQTGKWWEGHYKNAGFDQGMTTEGRAGEGGRDIGRKTMQPIYDFIDGAGDDPFFIWYAPVMPHRPFRPPARLLDKYEAEGIDGELAAYYAMCEWLDETVGDLMDFVEERSDNTLVLFAADNGWEPPNEHSPKTGNKSKYSPTSKLSPYDGGLRTPITVWWPGHVEPGVYREPVSTIDLAPTVLKAAGLQPPSQLPGHDLRDIAAGRLHPKAVFGELYTHDAVDIEHPESSLTHRWVRYEDWKLIAPVDSSEQPELYHLGQDPMEKTDLATQRPDKVRELLARLDSWHSTSLGQKDQTWYRGNLHTHSLWKGGDDYPEVIIDWYRRHDYDFIALSDHNTIAEGEKWVVVDRPKMRATYEAYVKRFGHEWVEEKQDGGAMKVRLKTFDEYRSLLEEPGRFLIIRSEEISDRFEKLPVHVNATNISEYIEPKGGTSVLDVMQNNVDAVLEQRQATGQAMFPHLNHPNFRWAVTAEDLIALQGERFFEVYNGHPLVHNRGDDDHPNTERIWDIVLTKRLANGDDVMYGLATDDAHRYHQFDSTQSNPGRGWVMIHAEALTPEAIIKAMEAGDFYATTGVYLEDVQRRNSQISLQIRPEPGVEYVTQFIGTRKGFDSTSVAVPPQEGERGRRRYSDEIGEVLAEVEGVSPSYRLRGDEIYVRANVVSTKPKENGTHASEVEEAWIQPYVPAK